MIITGSDPVVITSMKNLCLLHYFLGIEIAYSFRVICSHNRSIFLTFLSMLISLIHLLLILYLYLLPWSWTWTFARTMVILYHSPHDTGNLLEILSIFLLLGQISLMWYICLANLSVLQHQHIMQLFFMYFAIFVESWLSFYFSLLILPSFFELTQMLIGQMIPILVISSLVSTFFLDHLIFLDVASIKTLLFGLILMLSIKQWLTPPWS